MPQRTSRRRAARVVLLLTLFGLLAMHGLPDAMAAPMAGSGTAAAMTSSASMMSPPSAPAPMTGGHAQVRAADSPSPGGSSAAAMGCGMDHGNCVAVLREAAGHRGAPAVSAVVAAPGTPSPVARVRTPTRSLRAPPDVSLIGLGISRT